MNYKRKRDAKKNISNAPKEEKKVEAKEVKEEKDLKKSNHK